MCPRANGKGVQSELLGNVIIPLYAARALYYHCIIDYQNYFELWTNLKTPNSYRKYTKRFGSIISSKELRSFSILQGLIAIDNK